MKHLFIVNPIAGGQNNSGDCERKLKSELDKLAPRLPSEDSVIIYVTTGIMDASERVRREAMKGEALRIYACGGDGTLNECVHGVAGYSNAAVTHYPYGTGNDFIKLFGEDAKKFFDLEKLMFGNVFPADIIDVNGRKCLNIASVGIDARIAADVHKYSRLPIVGGACGYVVSLFVNLIKGLGQKFTVKTETDETTGKFSLVCACNGRYYGGGFNPVNTAFIDDGLMDILIIKKVSRFKAVRFLSKYAHGEADSLTGIVRHICGKHLEIHAEKPFAINVDGEILTASKAVMRMISGGVNVILPEGLSLSQLSNKENTVN